MAMPEKPSKRAILPPTMRRLTKPWKVILFLVGAKP
jgi:hypothetical protein